MFSIDAYCKSRGCSSSDMMGCCGRPEALALERMNKEERAKMSETPKEKMNKAYKIMQENCYKIFCKDCAFNKICNNRS